MGALIRQKYYCVKRNADSSGLSTAGAGVKRQARALYIPITVSLYFLKNAQYLFHHTSDVWVDKGGSRNEERLEQNWGLQPIPHAPQQHFITDGLNL